MTYDKESTKQQTEQTTDTTWIKDYRGWSVYSRSVNGEMSGWYACGPDFDDVIDGETLDDVCARIDKEVRWA